MLLIDILSNFLKEIFNFPFLLINFIDILLFLLINFL